MSLRHRAAALTVLLLVGAALASLFAQCSFSRAAPDPSDWQAAAEAAVAKAQPTDGIRVHPTWTETPLPFLTPVGNLLHRHHEPYLEDYARIERVLILTETARTGEALESLPFPAPPLSEMDHQRFGEILLIVAPIPEEWQLHADATDHLSEATVTIIEPAGGEPHRCGPFSPADRTWRCDGRDADAMVRPILLEMVDDPRRCVQAFPPTDRRVLSVELPFDVPNPILRVRAGLDQRSARIETGDDVIYRIYVDDELLREERHPAHESTWDATDITPGTDRVTLRVEVESVSPRPVQRRFCFNAWSLTEDQAQRSNR